MVIKNRKGFFFTVIIIIVLSMLLLSSTFYVKAQYREAVQKRVSTMNSYVTSTETNLERQMYMTGYRIIFLMETSLINSTLQPIQNPESLLSEGFFNGTLNNKPQPLLSDVKFSDFLSETDTDAKQMNLKINITNVNINLTQEDPWRIALILKANFFMADNSNLAQWNTSITVKSYIPIDRFDDPTYLLNTGGRITNKFKQSPYNNSFPINLSLHISGGYYISSTEAPSFLDRLTGNLASQSPYGIESLVDLQKLSEAGNSPYGTGFIVNTQGISISGGSIIPDKSIVDHIYFSNASTIGCAVAGLPSWVKIDQAHRAMYNLPACT